MQKDYVDGVEVSLHIWHRPFYVAGYAFSERVPKVMAVGDTEIKVRKLLRAKIRKALQDVSKGKGESCN